MPIDEDEYVELLSAQGDDACGSAYDRVGFRMTDCRKVGLGMVGDGCWTKVVTSGLFTRKTRTACGDVSRYFGCFCRLLYTVLGRCMPQT